MTLLRFVKMHANGDDFLVIDVRGRENPLTAEIVKRLGDRNRGIGFNQLAVVHDCDDAAARLSFWNADGTSLGACGSATRGAAHILMSQAGVSAIVLRTQRGLLDCRGYGEDGVTADMGRHLVNWDEVPLR
jgi:diaminopimelate epimerase